MRQLWTSILAVMMYATPLAAAQDNDPMALQRCIWACLANSKGAEDPAYHACVENSCSDETTPDNSEFKDAPTIRYVQKKLIALGYPVGSADGVFGIRTAESVKAFKLNNNLPLDGGINRAFLDALDKAQ